LYTHVVRLGHLPEALENDDDKSYERFALEVTSEEENVRHDLCRNFNQVRCRYTRQFHVQIGFLVEVICA